MTIVALAIALGASACSAPGASVGPTLAAPTNAASPGGSPSAACPTAPSVPDDLRGWGPPATAPAIVPILIASAGQLACGPNRVLFSLLDADGRPIATPDRQVAVDVYDLALAPDEPLATITPTFVWAIENERGVYVMHVSFPEAGRYGVAFRTPGEHELLELRLTFDVQPTSPVVKVGDRAPASKTPTLADVGGDPAKLSTDPSPNPDFYRTSVDRAIADHKPFVVIFATPKFCTSAQCGPTLDRIKPFAARYPGVTFINVEPYKLKLVNGVLQADLDAGDQLQTTAITDEWHLFNEPNVYVVNRDGVVTANFELIFSDAELTAALDATDLSPCHLLTRLVVSSACHVPSRAARTEPGWLGPIWPQFGHDRWIGRGWFVDELGFGRVDGSHEPPS